MTDEQSSDPPEPLRPAAVCRKLLVAVTAENGRRGKGKRQTSPDAAVLALRRELLEHATRADPEPDAFEAWLETQCTARADAAGALRTAAREIVEDWRLAQASPDFRRWLDRGAPPDDNGS